MIEYNPRSNRFLTVATTKTSNGQKDVRLVQDIQRNVFYSLDDDGNFERINHMNQMIFVESLEDLPAVENGVISLEDNVTYFITQVVDLQGNRLVCGENTTIIGGSSENCRLKSTGLIGTALITSQYSLPIRNITIEADVALDLQGDGVTTAIDWFGVNFTDCNVVGTIADYSNFIMTDSALLNSGNMTFTGTMGTIGFSQCLFNNISGSTAIILHENLTVTRRFRIIYSSFITLSGETSISVDPLTTINTESFILDTVNFSGGGAYLDGVNALDNITLFIKCVGITNTSVHGQMYMQNNATATTISNTTNFVKVEGITTAYSDNEKYSHSNNRLTNEAIIEREYLIQCTLSFAAGNNNVCEFGFFSSRDNQVLTRSIIKSTANASGRAENITFMTLAKQKAVDYIEVWVRNTSAVTNVTVSDMNVVITEIS
jgi:hypothetical protein